MTAAAPQLVQRTSAAWERLVPTRRTDGPSWLAGFREAAERALRERGFPQAGDEAWRHMGLEAVTGPSWRPEAEACRVDASGVPGISVSSWENLGRRPEPVLRGASERPLPNLNALHFRHPVDIRAGKNVCALRPLRLTPGLDASASAAAGWAIHPRASVLLESGSRLDLILDCSAFPETDGLVNLALDLDLHEQTALNLVLIGPSSRTVCLVDVSVRQQRDSVFRAFCFETRPRLDRLDLAVSLEGENASTDLFGLALMGGESRAFHHLNVDHRVPHTRSYQVFKSILSGSARFEYDSMVTIHPEAPNSASEQLNKNLVLSDAARAYARPQLAIHTDEVQCHHGATVGQMSAEELLYLRTRGIDPASASALVLRGFVDDLLKEIPVGAVTQELQKRAHDQLREIAR